LKNEIIQAEIQAEKKIKMIERSNRVIFPLKNYSVHKFEELNNHFTPFKHDKPNPSRNATSNSILKIRE